MAKRDRSTLKGYFITGATPTQDQFEDLFDSVMIQDDDLVATPEGGPLRIYAGTESRQPVINFYEGIGEESPFFSFDFAPFDDSGQKHGFNISDRQGKSRLFLHRDEPRVGVGTKDPQASLHVAGDVRIEGQLLGAANDEQSSLLRIVVGNTPPGNTAWKDYPSDPTNPGIDGVIVDIDTSWANFEATPRYFTSLAGKSHHWEVRGAASIYNASKDGFSVYLLHPATSTSNVNEDIREWYVNWIAIGQ